MLGVPENLPDNRHRRGAIGRYLVDRAPQPRCRLRVTHEALASPLRFKLPAAVLLTELMQHASPLRPSHPGLGPRDGGRRPR
jgi:hypothetical protein